MDENDGCNNRLGLFLAISPRSRSGCQAKDPEVDLKVINQ